MKFFKKSTNIFHTNHVLDTIFIDHLYFIYYSFIISKQLKQFLLSSINYFSHTRINHFSLLSNFKHSEKIKTRKIPQICHFCLSRTHTCYQDRLRYYWAWKHTYKLSHNNVTDNKYIYAANSHGTKVIFIFKSRARRQSEHSNACILL